MVQAPSLDLASLAATPLARIRAVREYANLVFDDEARTATWLSRANRAIGNGLCAAGAACQEPEGFAQAMAELARLERAILVQQTPARATSSAAPQG